MAVTYVKDFTFPIDFGFHKNGSASVPGKARGGHITTPQRYRDGGRAEPPQSKYAGHSKHSDAKPRTGAGASNLKYKHSSDTAPPKTTTEKSSGMQAPAFRHGGKMHRKADGGSMDVAEGAVKMGKKSSWNKDDAVSPGSPKRVPPSQSMKNSSAARDKFATTGKGTEPATKQTGNVERMSGWSDFKHGGKVHKKAKGGHATGCGCSMCGGGSMKMAKGGHVSKMEPGEKKAMHRDRPRNMGENPQAGGHDTKPSSTPYDYKHGGKVKADRFERGPRGHKSEHGAGSQKYADGGKVGADRYEESDERSGGMSERKDTSGTSAKVAGDGEAYKSGGRIKNLGHYAHGGKARSEGSQKGVNASKYESAAGTPKVKKEPRGEMPSGKATGKHTKEAQGTIKGHGSSPTGHERTMASGGLSRGTSPKRNAAIHAKMSHKPGAGALASVAGLLGGQGLPKQPMGAAPPGMAPGMGSPPGNAMGAMSPQGPSLGSPAMAHGGKVTHVVHHVIRHNG